MFILLCLLCAPNMFLCFYKSSFVKHVFTKSKFCKTSFVKIKQVAKQVLYLQNKLFLSKFLQI
uniref:Uncharacterized protein n=1 Tax=Meloidogyne enterolobii TaxID=390850 RepID=A0A6V7XKK2_MELEN|nr:unnamed protein product [Meloidogyne enterolobii]